MDRSDSSLSLIAQWSARLYLLTFFIFSLYWLPGNDYLTGAVLQQIFIAGLIIFRLRQRSSLFLIPDEMLVCLPYFWALATVGNASIWFVNWQWFFIAVFALSMLVIVSGKRWFVGGLWQNSLLLAIYCAMIFVLIFAIFLRSVFPPFTDELFRDTLLNFILFFAGLPVCLVAAPRRFGQPAG